MMILRLDGDSSGEFTPLLQRPGDAVSLLNSRNTPAIGSSSVPCHGRINKDASVMTTMQWPIYDAGSVHYYIQHQKEMCNGPGCLGSDSTNTHSRPLLLLFLQTLPSTKPMNQSVVSHLHVVGSPFPVPFPTGCSSAPQV